MQYTRKSSRSVRFTNAVTTAVGAALAAMSFADNRTLATDYIWSGSYPVNGNWASILNWSPFIGAPGAGERASFIAVTSLRATAELSTGTTSIGTLGVSGQSAVGPYIFQGVGGSENLRVTNNVIIDNSIGASNVTFSGVDVYANVTTVANASTLNISGSMTYTGTTLFATGGTGAFNVNSGNTLRAPVSHGSSGTSTVGGLLDTIGFDITGGGVVNVTSTGFLILNNGSSINNGLLQMSGTMTFAGGALDVSGSGDVYFPTSHALASGAIVHVTSGADIVADSYLDLGNGNSGTLTVDGSGSTISASGLTDWGAGALGNASVTFSNFGAGTYSTLRLGQTGGKADVSLLSGSTLTTNASLLVGPGTGTSSLASVTVANASLTNNGTTFFQNGGKLALGTGGAVNLNGDATFATGSTFTQTGGFLTIASGKTLHIAGGVVNKTGGSSALSNGATLRIAGGGQFTTSSFFDIANGSATGTLIVDGAGSKFNSTSGVTDIGKNAGNFGTLSISNSGVGTYNGLQLSLSGGKSVTTLSTSGQLIVNSGLSAGGTASAATINIAGGTLNSVLSAGFNNGAVVNLSSGGLVLGTTSTFFTGSTLNQTGGALTLPAAASINFNGGFGTILGGQGIPNGTSLRITNGGHLDSASYLDLARNLATGTLLVDGAGSRITTLGGLSSDWGFSTGNSATATFSNSGAGTFSSLTMSNNGGTTLVNISTNGLLSTTNSLIIGSPGATANINISGGSLNSAGTALFLNGTAVNVTGTGLLRLGGNSTFSTGSTFNGTASTTNSGLNWADATTLAFDGGAGTIAAIGSGIPNNGTLRITNGGSFTTVENFNIGNGTLLVDGPGSKLIINNATSGTNFWAQSSNANITFSNNAVGTMTGAFQLAVGNGTAAINVTSGATFQSAAFFTTFSPTGTATINVNGGTLRTTGSSNVNGGATLNYAAGTVEIGGTLAVGAANANARVLLTPGGDKTLRVGGLDIPAVNGGKVDLSNNSMIVDHTGVSPINTIRGYLQTGRNGGNWLGNGVTSSAAAGSLQTAIGYVEASSIGSPASFFGYSIDNTTVLLAYTWYGDATFDGKVNTLDFNIMAGNFGGSGKVWTNGDFDYNGTVNSVDFGLLVGSYGQTSVPAAPLPGPTAGPQLGSVVPEPTCLGIIATFPILARRRRMA